MTVTRDMTIAEVGAVVSEALSAAGIHAVLSGGAVVSVYSENEYESKDLDFISSASPKKIASALAAIGFTRSSGRHFAHTDTEYYVEFPTSPLAVGSMVVRESTTVDTRVGRLVLLTPTYSVMDRLAAFYHWNDRQGLDQAVMVARRHAIDVAAVRSWSVNEGALAKFEIFADRYDKAKNVSS